MDRKRYASENSQQDFVAASASGNPTGAQYDVSGWVMGIDLTCACSLEKLHGQN